jgi:hypothetical protein
MLSHFNRDQNAPAASPSQIALLHPATGWGAGLPGEVAEHLLMHALAVRTGQGHFLADLTLG